MSVVSAAADRSEPAEFGIEIPQLSLRGILAAWVVIPLILIVVAVTDLIPTFAAPEDRDFTRFVQSDAGKAFLRGAWLWYGWLGIAVHSAQSVFFAVLGLMLVLGRT